MNGLTAARGLARKGYRVTIFERYPVPGGVMWAGVPEWRLPRDVIMEEVELITDLGIEVRYNTEVGKDIQFKDLVDNYDAVLISAGCQVPQSLGVPGEDLDGVVSGLQFLEDVNLGTKDVWVGKRVVTVGGGFTSMDCVRTVLRMGSERSVMTYRRSIQEIPVDELELEEAEIEGVEIMYMVAPTRVIGDENGKVIGLELVRNELGAPDSKGRRRPEPVKGSEFVSRLRHGAGRHRSEAGCPLPRRHAAEPRPPRRAVPRPEPEDRAAERLGVRRLRRQPDQLHLVDRRGAARGRPDRPRPARRQPEGQGDGDHTGPDRVRLHAESAPGRGHRRLEPDRDEPPPRLGRRLRGRRPSGDAGACRSRIVACPHGDTTLEVEVGYTKPIGFEEAKRCLQCQLNIFIDGNRCILCNGCVDACPHRCIEMISPDRIYSIDNDVELAEMARAELGPYAAAMVIDERSCIRCGICVDWCPTECLTMDHFRLTPPRPAKASTSPSPRTNRIRKALQDGRPWLAARENIHWVERGRNPVPSHWSRKTDDQAILTSA